MDLRALHRKLEIGKDFSNWAKKRLKDLIKGIDYEILLPNSRKQVHGGHNRSGYAVAIECAKHIAMMEQTAQVRQESTKPISKVPERVTQCAFKNTGRFRDCVLRLARPFEIGFVL